MRNIENILLYSNLISRDTQNYKTYPKYLNRIVQVMEYCFLRMQTLYFRMKESFHYRTCFFTDARVSRHMIDGFPLVSISSLSLSQLQTFHKVCKLFIRRKVNVGSLTELDNKINSQILQLQSIVIQINVRKFLTRLHIKKEQTAAIQIQKAFRGFSTRKILRKEKAYNRLQISDEIVQDGYGEYVVFYPPSESRLLNKQVFDLAYDVISKYAAIPNRLEFIQRELQEIDKSLKIAFIPRTLYELVYIRAAIEEEMGDKEICTLQCQPNSALEFYQKLLRKNGNTENDQRVDYKLANCWHLGYFGDRDPADNNNEYIKLLAYRMNQRIIEKFHPQGFFTGKQLVKMTKDQLEFYKNHSRNVRKTFPHFRYGSLGATINFGLNSEITGIKCSPMTIENEEHCRVIFNAVSLECSEMARNAFIIYRGGDLDRDREISSEEIKGTSISYGTSLFAGAFRDGEATVFYYTRKKRPTYSVIIPFGEVATCPFYIPRVHTIGQLLSEGEYFHARSKLPKDTLEDAIINGIWTTTTDEGIWTTIAKRPVGLVSSYNLEELVQRIVHYVSKAVLLTL